MLTLAQKKTVKSLFTYAAHFDHCDSNMGRGPCSCGFLEMEESVRKLFAPKRKAGTSKKKASPPAEKKTLTKRRKFTR